MFTRFHSAAFSLATLGLIFTLTPQQSPAQCCGRLSVNQPRIVGGSTAVRGAYPWMTALVERGQTPSAGQFCGAALIAPQWVLTAGHCIEDTTAARLDVIVGAYNLTETNGGGQRIQVTQIIKHPSYGEVNGILSNDVALLKLATPVTNVAVLGLNDSAARTAAGMACRGMGFGAVVENGSGSSVLLQVDLGFISLATASSVYGTLNGGHLAAGIASGGRDTCQGDSGGPLVVADGTGGWLHAGVVSFGDGCARAGVPGIYANTANFVPWIRQQIGTVTPAPTDDHGNTIATATSGTLATAIAGNLAVAGDIDFIKFTTTGAGTLTLASTGTTALSAAWQNSAGTNLVTQTGAPNVTLNAALTAAGTYYARIAGAAATTTGAYSLRATFTPTPVTTTPEIGLLGKNGTAIADGDVAPTTTKGTAFGSTNVGTTLSQVFTVQNTGTGTLTLGAPVLSGTGAAHFRISVAPAASIAAGRTGTFTVAFAPTAAGAHVAKITMANNDANENPYDFQITGTGVAVVATDDHGDTTATATNVSAIPAKIAGNIKSNDRDYFKVVLTAATTLTFRTTGTIDTYGTLYSATGAVLANHDDISTTNYNFSIRRSLAAGTYYIAVRGYDSSVTGNYSFEVVR